MHSDSLRFSFSQSRHTQFEPSGSQIVPMGVGKMVRRGIAWEHCLLSSHFSNGFGTWSRLQSSPKQTGPGPPMKWSPSNWRLLGALCHKRVS